MAPLEERQRETQQVLQETGSHFERQRALQVDQYPGTEQPGDGVDDHDDAKAEREHRQQGAIVLHHGLVHRKLHVERARQNIGLQDHRQYQRLEQRRSQPADGAEQLGQPGTGNLRARLEFGRRRKFQGDAGEMSR